ncbi:MAG: double-strand break repair helicase AddA [Hyphomonadaceae bacterium]|nr:double-strand break repair helicase AddA [Hyphomonadaceae bacterium]
MIDPVFSPDTEAFEQAKKAQADAANPEQSAWVEANAGSGKTKVLIDRVARLLLRRDAHRPGANPDSILCITYTKAAANEMLARLYARLGKWAVATDETLRASLSELEDRDPSTYSEDEFREARRLFARALETPGGLRIETIHAFCARILRRFPLEARVSPGFKAIEEDEADSLWRTVLADGMMAAAAAQPDAMNHLAEATGGLGIGAALEALKFKRQALQRFRQSISSETELTDLVRRAAGAPDLGRADLLDQAMIRDLPESALRRVIDDLSGLAKPGKADAKLLNALVALLSTSDAETRYSLYMSAIAGANWDFPAGSNPYTAKAGPVTADLFSRNQKSEDPEGREIARMKTVQATLKAIELADRSVALMQIGLPLIDAYAKQKRLLGALDFDDLIDRTHTLLTRSSAAKWVLYKLDGGVSHLLLDEAQDTSPPQWALINAIVEEFQSGLGQDRVTDPRTQFVVGDPKQSIYSFQGADQQQFEAEHDAFVRREEIVAAAQNRSVNQPDMVMSFRSTPEVLQFVDEVRAIAPLERDATDPLPPREADIAPHAPRRANQPGRVELWPLELPTPKAVEDSAWTTPTDHVPADAPRRRLARSIAQAVKSMLDGGESVWRERPDGRWQRQPVQPEDVLILVRSRNELFDALIDSLKQEKIPVAGADRLRLLDNLGVQDCLNLIRFALQPGDDLTLAEILRGPFCGLVDDDRHLFVLAHGRDEGESLWARLAGATDAEFANAKAFCAALIETRHLPAFEFLTRALTERDESGLSGWDRLIQRLGEPVRDPVQALLSGALGYDMSQAKSLQAFLAETEQQNTVLKRELGEPDGAVRVMTVHGAKGLQAPIVILPDTTGATKPVSDALFFTESGVPLYSPSGKTDAPASARLRETANAAAERESRRLLYVALTRASDRLIIAGAGMGNAKAGYAKSSWYRWCLSAMRTLLDQDDADLPDKVLTFGADTVQLAKETREAPALITSPDWLKRTAREVSPPLRLAAPSRLAEDRSAVSLPFAEERKAALKRGRLIHALLQILPEYPAPVRAEKGRAFLNRDPDLEAADRDEMLEVTLRTLSDPAFTDVFEETGRSEAAIVGTLPKGQMVNGRVDRLIVKSDQVMIIDYKTDRPAPKSAEHIEDSYLVQMAAYRSVLGSVYPKHDVRCALLYTDGPRLIELDADKMSESLNRVESRV